MRINKLFGSLLLGVIFFGLAATSASAAGITGTKKVSVRWTGIKEAESYNIYYKEKYESGFTHAVRDLSKDSREYTIGYLKNSVKYVYKLCAIKGDKTEFWCSQTMTLGKGVTAEKTIINKTISSSARQSTVSWVPNEKAEHYYVFYKKVGEKKWTHSVIGLDHSSTSYTIKYLDNVAYQYQLVAVDGNYKPIAWSQVKMLR